MTLLQAKIFLEDLRKSMRLTMSIFKMHEAIQIDMTTHQYWIAY